MQFKCSNDPLLQVEKLGWARQSDPSGGWGREKVASTLQGTSAPGLAWPGLPGAEGAWQLCAPEGLRLEGFAATLWNC